MGNPTAGTGVKCQKLAQVELPRICLDTLQLEPDEGRILLHLLHLSANYGIDGNARCVCPYFSASKFSNLWQIVLMF